MARRATSLGPKPSKFFCFLLLLFQNKRNRFSPKMGPFVYFQGLPFFLVFFVHSPFSISLSSSVRSSLFFLFRYRFLLCIFLLAGFFSFLTRTTSNIKLEWFVHQSFFCLGGGGGGVPVLLCLSNPFSYLCCFLFQLVHFVQHHSFWTFKKDNS